jgi:hypothetical protein
VRRAFLEQSGARYLLSRVRGARTVGEVAAGTRICDRPGEALGRLVPVAQEGDLVLFELRVE